jgi:hypothetical protein
MTMPVLYTHRIEFQTEVRCDHRMHKLVSDEVHDELRLLAPLMIKERLLKLELEDLRAKIQEIRK